MAYLSSFFYSIIVGGVFIFLFIYLYDFFYGEKHEKQVKKISKEFRKENIKKVELLEHHPKKFSMYKVITDKETKKIKVKPGYRIIKMVPSKNNQ